MATKNATQTETIKSAVRNLLAGDVTVATGETILRVVEHYDTMKKKFLSTHRDVLLQSNSTGSVREAMWNSSTLVTVTRRK